MMINKLPPLSEMARLIVVGGTYEHYKKLRYRVVAVVRHSESLEEMVVYEALYGDRDVWVRPLEMFLEPILIEGVLEARFKLVDT